MRAMMDLKMVPWPPGSSSRMPEGKHGASWQRGLKGVGPSENKRQSCRADRKQPRTNAAVPYQLLHRKISSQPKGQFRRPGVGTRAPCWVVPTPGRAGAAPTLQHHGGVDHFVEQDHFEVARGAQLQGRGVASVGGPGSDKGVRPCRHHAVHGAGATRHRGCTPHIGKLGRPTYAVQKSAMWAGMPAWRAPGESGAGLPLKGAQTA